MEARNLTGACRALGRVPGALALLAFLLPVGGCCNMGLTCSSPCAPAPRIGPYCPGLAHEPRLEGPCPPRPDLTGIPRGP